MAHIYEPRVREKTLSEGTGNIVLTGAMRGSLAFAQVMEEGDTADIDVGYDSVFTEVKVVMNGAGQLERVHCYRTRHADGTVDQEDLYLPPGMKTIIMTVAANKAVTLDGGVRFDVIQSLVTAEIKRALTNLSGPLWTPRDVTNAALLWPTGRFRAMLDDTAAPGWVPLDDGTIGDEASPASTRANDDCEALFTMIYNKISDAYAPLFTQGSVPTTRAAQGSPAAAWAAQCAISLPKMMGRLFGVAGAGAGLTARSLGQTVGLEKVGLVATELPAITQTFTGVGATWTANQGGVPANANVQSTAPDAGIAIIGYGGYIGPLTINITPAGTISGFGSNLAHENMPPAFFARFEIKL